MEKFKKYLIPAIILFLAFGNIYSQNSKAYKIIVNKSNPIESISQKNVSKIFLKKTTIWDNGEKIKPVDLKVNSSVRQNFSKDIHGKPVSAINSYWRKQIFSGNAVPPVEKSSDQEVLTYIKANSGAVGYVSVSTNVSGLKVIEVTR